MRAVWTTLREAIHNCVTLIQACALMMLHCCDAVLHGKGLSLPLLLACRHFGAARLSRALITM